MPPSSGTLLRERARTVARTEQPPASKLAKVAFANLMALPPEVRRGFFRSESEADQEQLLRVALSEGGTPYALFVDDPVGFIEDVLDETLWSKSREVVSSVAEHAVTAVPSCFGSSKTWGAARVDLWWAMVHAPGTALAVTIAPLFRQVVRQMWPEIRRAHHRASLPGQVDTYQMKMRTADGGLLQQVSYGLVANRHDESAVQGIHSPHLLLVVDEAGGIAPGVGRNMRAVLTGDDARLLAIGNPPSDEEGGWFEGLCNDSHEDDDVNVVRISAYDTPALSGEQAPRCKSCPSGLPAHSMSKHLVTKKWVTDTVREFGADSPYVQAKVHARFPRGGSDRALPYSWVEAANDNDDPTPTEDNDWTTYGDLELRDEQPGTVVRMHSWVRLGVDVAADGGDEFVVSRMVGDLLTIQHASSGPTNADAVNVAGKVLKEIKKAQLVAKAIDSPHRVRVKVDTIGVGWGVVGILRSWGSEGLHEADIVAVNVAEGTGRDTDPEATFDPALKRDELWLAFRELLPREAQDDGDGTEPLLRLRVGRKEVAQLTAPMYSTQASGGKTKVESKKSLRKRGMASPDRAEALLLAAYEPAPPKPKRRKGSILSD